jgi:hypothetical protein
MVPRRPGTSAKDLALLIRDRDGDDLQPVDPFKVGGITGVDGQTVRDSDRSDERVEGTRRHLPADAAQRGRDRRERACGLLVEGKGDEVSLGLLDVRLPPGSLVVVPGDKGTDGKLGQRDRGDQWLDREVARIGKAP